MDYEAKNNGLGVIILSDYDSDLDMTSSASSSSSSEDTPHLVSPTELGSDDSDDNDADVEHLVESFTENYESDGSDDKLLESFITEREKKRKRSVNYTDSEYESEYDSDSDDDDEDSGTDYSESLRRSRTKKRGRTLRKTKNKGNKNGRKVDEMLFKQVTDQDIAEFEWNAVLARNNPDASTEELKQALHSLRPIYGMAADVIRSLDDEFQQDLTAHLYSHHLSRRKNISRFPPQWTSWPLRPDLEDGPEDILPIDEDDVRDIKDIPRTVEGLGWKDPLNNRSLGLKASLSATHFSEEQKGITEMPSTHQRRHDRRISRQKDPFDVSQGYMQENRNKATVSQRDMDGLIVNLTETGNNQSVDSIKAQDTPDTLTVEATTKSKVTIETFSHSQKPLFKKFSEANILMSNVCDTTQVAPSAEKISGLSDNYYSIRKNWNRKNLDYIPPHNATDVYVDPDNPQALPYESIATGTSSLPKNYWRYKISDSMNAYSRIKYQYDPRTLDPVPSQLNPEIGLPIDELPEVIEKRLAHARQLMLFELNALFQRQIYDRIQVVNMKAQEKQQYKTRCKHRKKRNKSDIKQEFDEEIIEMENPFMSQLQSHSHKIHKQKDNHKNDLKKLPKIVPNVESGSPQLPLQTREKLLDLIDTILIQIGYHAHLSSGPRTENLVTWAEVLAKTGAGSIGNTYERCHNLFYKDIDDPRVPPSSNMYDSSTGRYSGLQTADDLKRELEKLLKNPGIPDANTENNDIPSPPTVVKESYTPIPSISQPDIPINNQDKPFSEDGRPIYDLFNYLFPVDYVTPAIEKVGPQGKERPIIRGNLTPSQILALNMGNQLLDPSGHFGNSKDPLNQYKSLLAEATAVPGSAAMRSPFECGTNSGTSGGGSAGRTNQQLNGNFNGTSTGPSSNKSAPAAIDALLGTYGLGSEYFVPKRPVDCDQESESPQRINTQEINLEVSDSRIKEELVAEEPVIVDLESVSQTTSRHPSHTPGTLVSQDKISYYNTLFRRSKDRTNTRERLIRHFRKQHFMMHFDTDIAEQSYRLRGLKNKTVFNRALWRKVPSVKEQGIHIDLSNTMGKTVTGNRSERDSSNPDALANDIPFSEGPTENIDNKPTVFPDWVVPKRKPNAFNPIMQGWGNSVNGSGYPMYIREILSRLESRDLPLSLPEALDKDNIPSHGVTSNTDLMKQLQEWELTDRVVEAESFNNRELDKDSTKNFDQMEKKILEIEALDEVEEEEEDRYTDAMSDKDRPPNKQGKARVKILLENHHFHVRRGYRPDLIPLNLRPSYLSSLKNSVRNKESRKIKRAMFYDKTQISAIENGIDCNFELIRSKEDEENDIFREIDPVPVFSVATGKKVDNYRYWNGVNGEAPPKLTAKSKALFGTNRGPKPKKTLENIEEQITQLNNEVKSKLDEINGPGEIDSSVAHYGTFRHLHHGRRFVGMDSPSQSMTPTERHDIPLSRRLYLIGYTGRKESVDANTVNFLKRYPNLRYVFDGPDVPGAPIITQDCVGGMFDNQEKLGLTKPFGAFTKATKVAEPVREEEEEGESDEWEYIDEDEQETV